MNYQSQEVSARMGLDEALKAFSGEICYLTLKDGTNIEIIPQNQPEMGYIDNQLYNQDNFNDEFVEENYEDNYNYNYEEMEYNNSGVFRGKGQNVNPKKSRLRKTILKSIDGKEKKVEKEEKLRNVNEKIIFEHTENNNYLQCANCLKFFLTEENESESKTNPQTPNKQDVRQQPQQQKQNLPQNQQKIPQNKQQYPPNQQMGIPQRPNQPQQKMPGQQTPQKIRQQNYQQMPQQQKGVPNQKQKNNVLPGNMRPNQQRIPNQVFRARKKESNRYASNNDRYIIHKNNYFVDNNINYNTDESNYYLSWGKQKKENKICPECSSKKKMPHNNSYRNIDVAKNLQFGYTDDNLYEYMENDYYEYPNNY